MPNVSDLRGKLLASLPDELAGVVEQAAGIAADWRLHLYVVGGAVRDLLLGQLVREVDLVVEGGAPAFGKALAQVAKGEVVARSQFGTVRLRLAGHTVDIATARFETYRRPGALPTVGPGTIMEDLRRRDFTINAMGVRIAPAPVQLLDPTGGQDDIRARLIRVLHASSFQDDATRILRAVRYEQRLGFHLDAVTDSLLRRDLAMLDTISGDRLRRELELLFQEPQPRKPLLRAAEMGVLSAIYPHLPDVRSLQARLDAFAQAGAPMQPLLGLLAYGLDTAQAEGLIARLKLPARQCTLVRDMVSLQGQEVSLAEETSPVATFRRLQGVMPEAVRVVAALSAVDGARRNLRRYLAEWRDVRSILTGRELASLGVPPGPQMGVLLAALRDARLEGVLVTRRDEEAFVRARLVP